MYVLERRRKKHLLNKYVLFLDILICTVGIICTKSILDTFLNMFQLEDINQYVHKIQCVIEKHVCNTLTSSMYKNITVCLFSVLICNII